MVEATVEATAAATVVISQSVSYLTMVVMAEDTVVTVEAMADMEATVVATTDDKG